jgi:hypothetical protein
MASPRLLWADTFEGSGGQVELGPGITSYSSSTRCILVVDCVLMPRYAIWPHRRQSTVRSRTEIGAPYQYLYLALDVVIFC